MGGKVHLKFWRVIEGRAWENWSLSFPANSAYVPYIELDILIGSEVKLEKQIQN